MNAGTIAAVLGETYRTSGDWRNTRCPVCRGSGKLGLKVDGHKLVVHCFKGCAYADIMAAIELLDLFDADNDVAVCQEDDAEQTRLKREAQAEGCRRRIALASDIWQQSHPAPGTLVETYLRSRGITLPAPASLRLHGLHFGAYSQHPSGERRPQMVALVEHAEHGPVAVSRTFLAIDGSQKASLDPVRIFTGPVTGGAVRLGPVRPDQWLAIGEGIETVLSAMQLWDCPSGWAALSARGLRNLILPPEARMVWIAVDNDENGVGQAAARDAAWLWNQEGRIVRVRLPPNPGTDFNDILNGTHL